MGYGVAEVKDNVVKNVVREPSIPQNVSSVVAETGGKSELKPKEEVAAPEVAPPPTKPKIPSWLILVIILVLFILVIRR